MQGRRVIILLLLSAVAATGVSAADKSAVKAAAKNTNQVFSDVSFVAKMNLGRYVHHYVLPDGSPAPQKKKKQGKGAGKSTIQMDSGVKVHQGETGHSLRIYVKKNEIWVGLNKKAGATLNPAMVHILLGREVSPDDLEPDKIARALTSVVEIAGFEPGADVAAAFDEAIHAAEENPPEVEPLASHGPTVQSLHVSTKASRMHAGETVELLLEYEVDGPSGAVAVTETRTLSFGGVMIPTYPVREDLSREPGHHISNYRQTLPSSAESGVYEYKGEICVGGDCISRTTTFEIVN